MNGICRGYTGSFKGLEQWMNNAQATHSAHAYGLALGELVALSLKQDKQLQAVPVPPALAARMRPILALMRQIDTHLRRSIADAKHEDGYGMASELKTVSQISAPLNNMLDAAGLPDCGSNQT